MRSPPETPPLPLFGSGHQARPQRVALHIAGDRENMLVCLHRKRFETSLVDQPSSRGLVMGMPPLGVRHRDPPQHLGEFSVSSWPQNQMPMSRHQAIGRDAQARGGMGFSKNLFKGGVVGRCLEERQAADSTVQYMFLCFFLCFAKLLVGTVAYSSYLLLHTDGSYVFQFVRINKETKSSKSNKSSIRLERRMLSAYCSY